MSTLFTRRFILLTAAFLWGNYCPCAFADDEGNPSVETTPTTESAAVSEIVSEKFAQVSSDAIELEMSAQADFSDAAKSDVDAKIRAKYTPVRISILNRSGKLLKIPISDVYFINAKGEKVSLPSEAEIFKNVKRNGIVRAAAWGVPIGVCTFGLLAGPTIVASGAHTKVTNGTVKANIQKNCFHGGHLSPEGAVSTMVFIPKKQKEIQQVAFGRVINLEDEVETTKIIGIENNEGSEKKHLAKKQ
jgi:hypothetical protein